jgi:tRNA-specific 2-thiouridylase
MPKKTFKNQKKRVLMALSGGIDSAVSAWKLIQAGYEVEAAFMKNWSSTKGLKYDECPWLQDRQDALRVAAFLGIPMHTVDFEKQYEKNVLDYFFKEYKAGRTPNPDVMCNKEIKFKLLYNWAMDHGFDYMATGHYAQVIATRVKSAPVDNFIPKGTEVKNEKAVGKWSSSKSPASLKALNTSAQEASFTFTLQRSADEFKDQTYFIYNITTPQLPNLLFPIGSMKKSAVKELAKKIGLPNADKKESMGLCFVGKIRLKEFLAQKVKSKPGAIVTADGQIIGEHQGLATYTVGQRQGVRIGAGGPWFVAAKDLKKNQLTVTNNPHDKLLETKEIEIHSVNWLTPPDNFPTKLKARYRHQGELQSVSVEPSKIKNHYTVKFAKPQLAIASGQSLVMYNGKVCVGGGVIV